MNPILNRAEIRGQEMVPDAASAEQKLAWLGVQGRKVQIALDNLRNDLGRRPEAFEAGEWARLFNALDKARHLAAECQRA